MAKSKKIGTKVTPVHATKTSGLLNRVESPLTPELFRNRFLLGLPKVLPNGDQITDDILKDRIMLAMNEVELLVGVPVDPIEVQDRLPFDRNLYKSFVHLRTTKRPIVEVTDLAIYSANGEKLFNLPLEWVDNGQFTGGQINVIPYLASYSGTTATGIVSNAGIAFLATLETVPWVQSYWSVTYTTGMCTKSGNIPAIVNELVGVIGTMHLLSMFGPSNPYTSTSLSQDSIGQSSSSAGINTYTVRISELEKRKEELVRKIRGMYYTKRFISNI